MNKKKLCLISVFAIVTIGGCNYDTTNTININTNNNQQPLAKSSGISTQTQDISDNIIENDTIQTNNDDIPSTYSYENKNQNFGLQIPNTWTFKENSNGFDCIMFAPNDKNNIKENIGIKVQELKVSETVDTFVERTIMEISELYTDFKKKSEKNININGLSGKYIIYEFGYPEYTDIRLKAQQTVFITKDRSYTIQYTATDKTFKNYEDDLKTIINSFKLLN